MKWRPLIAGVCFTIAAIFVGVFISNLVRGLPESTTLREQVIGTLIVAGPLLVIGLFLTAGRGAGREDKEAASPQVCINCGHWEARHRHFTSIGSALRGRDYTSGRCKSPSWGEQDRSVGGCACEGFSPEPACRNCSHLGHLHPGQPGYDVFMRSAEPQPLIREISEPARLDDTCWQVGCACTDFQPQPRCFKCRHPQHYHQGEPGFDVAWPIPSRRQVRRSRLLRTLEPTSCVAIDTAVDPAQGSRATTDRFSMSRWDLTPCSCPRFFPAV